jgi:hypothetical protein
MRKARIALLLVSVPFLLFAQQQNDGDSPSGKIHFVVRGDDSEKQIYLSEPSRSFAVSRGFEVFSEIFRGG